ncbi:XrtA/PEP-CTERM system TPR-repeat protein PrsT [Massilia rhizosphaerae]|uniref:XrtA/PEP-CTERM system TPR-repeat protein PrsT n=1 Tax=Massilia rhizosphaerae TaxID=2784389 RepID=UPI0018DE7D91|nr:XrtA/PEP-CTERM system TPR-repeat protein PrsT [Massilia rhizosphaerae]
MRTAAARRLAGALLVAALAATLPGCDRPTAAQQRAQAVQLRGQGDFKGALIVLKNALEAEPASTETRYLLARTYLDLGDSTSAEKEARQALDRGYARGPALAALAAALVMEGQHRKALDDTRDGPDDPALSAARGDAWLALGRNDEARTAYEHVLAHKPDDPAALVGMGRLAIVEGHADVAHAYADRILARDPRNVDGLMFKADLVRAGDQPAQALALYDRVLAISPQHRTAHVEKAYLAIGLHRPQMAQAELDLAAKMAPGSLLVGYTQALLDYTTNKPDAARDVLYKVLKAVPNHMPSVLLAGAVDLRLGSYYQAEQYFRRFLERNPGNVYARKLLAQALIGSGHADEARTVLEPVLDARQVDAQVLGLAADANLQTRRFGQAAEFFARASALDATSASLRTGLGLSRLGEGETDDAVRELQAATQLDKNAPEASEALVQANLKLGRRDAALDAARALERAQPGKPLPYALAGQVLAAQGKPDAARASFAHALQLDPAYYRAAAGLSQLALDAQQPAHARQVLADFLGRNKTSVEAMAGLAALAERAHDTAQVTHWLEQAAAVDPRAIGPGVDLCAQYLRTRRADKALALARRLQVSHPENPDLLDLLGKAQLAGGDLPAALESYKQLAQALPRSAPALMQVAALRLMQNNTTQAEDDLKSVLAIQPDFPSAQLELAALYVRKGSPDLALMIAEHMQRQHPQGAAGYQLQGDILMAKRQPAAALAPFLRAYALHATNELAIKIDNALREAGRTAEADSRLGAWLAAHPDDLRVQAYRAQTWIAAGDFKRAAAQLEAVARRQRDNAVVLNNLAVSYQALGDARAQATAEAALKLAPKRPDVMDTLGWILVGKGDAARAVTVLRDARALAPKARDIRYHLAAALAASGDKDGARKELDGLLAGDMRFAQAEDARKLMARLKSGG